MEDVGHIFRQAGAVLEGHFLLTSGLHSPYYWEKIRVLQQPELTAPLCAMIADHFREQAISAVAGPVTGGIVVSYEVARQLGVRAVFAEKGPQGRVIARGLGFSPGERVLVVDDILTTGGSLVEVAEAVRQMGGEPVAAAVLVDRSNGQVKLPLPFFSCHQTEVIAYRPGECPLCAAGLPLVRLGG